MLLHPWSFGGVLMWQVQSLDGSSVSDHLTREAAFFAAAELTRAHHVKYVVRYIHTGFEAGAL